MSKNYSRLFFNGIRVDDVADDVGFAEVIAADGFVLQGDAGAVDAGRVAADQGVPVEERFAGVAEAVGAALRQPSELCIGEAADVEAVGHALFALGVVLAAAVVVVE